MEIIARKDRKDEHPYIPELKELVRQGRITRREFLRNATLLGMSATAAYAAAGVFLPKTARAAGIKRGGTVKAAQMLQLMDHPARLSWTEGANVVRQCCDYLVECGGDNVSRPWLCERWTASEDLKTWDLYLRKDVDFNNGQHMTADDVIFTMNEWLNPDVGSSMLGLLSYWGGPQNIEKVNDYHIRLHLAAANIGVPEHLFHYPGMILPRTFEGDFIKQPVGTGPFTLEEFIDGERAVLKARPGYWKKGEDGKPLPYIDEFMFIAMDKDAGMAGIQAGQLDTMYNFRPGDYMALKDNPNLDLYTVDTSYTYVTRMRVDLAPWDDNRVRTALKMCQDREKCLEVAGYNLGVPAIDAHISPAHPAYCKKPIPPYDPQGARKLMEEYAKEKGLKLPIPVRLASKNNGHEPDIAQVLKQTALPGGFDIQLDITEPSGYWDRWTEVDLGITSWTHRPLATMVLPLAYTKEAIGAWNETRWYDEEFSALLTKAQGTLDVEKRRTMMCRLEDIFQEKGPIGINYWTQQFHFITKKYKNAWIHPALFWVFPRDMHMVA